MRRTLGLLRAAIASHWKGARSTSPRAFTYTRSAIAAPDAANSAQPTIIARSFSITAPTRTTRLRGRPLLQVLLQQAKQFVFLVRLAEVLVHAQFERLAAMLFGRARRDHDDRNVGRGARAADVARQV